MNSFLRSRTSRAGTAARSDGEAISRLDVCSAVWIIGVLLEVGEYENGRARRIASRARGREYGYSAEEHAESHPTTRIGAKSNRFRHSSVTPASDPGLRDASVHRVPSARALKSGVRASGCFRHVRVGRFSVRLPR